MRLLVLPYKKIAYATLVFVVVFSSFPLLAEPVYSRTADEIQEDIDKQKKELDAIQKQLKAAQGQLGSLENQLSGAQGEVPRLLAEIKKIGAEINYNKLQIKLLQENKQLKTLEKEDKELRQDRAMQQGYLAWRMQSKFASFLSDDGAAESLKHTVYQNTVLASEGYHIADLGDELVQIATDLDGFQKNTSSLQKQNKELQRKKAEAEARIYSLQNSLSSTSGVVAGLRSEKGILQANVEQLSAEQKAVQEYEAWLLGQSGNGGTNEVQPGKIYFTGRGRDVAQGHGVGMSQYGAKGAAAAGLNSTQILQYYYKGAKVVNYDLSLKISVKYCPGNPALDAYQDGCAGGAQPVVQRVYFDTYLSGLGEMPESWPTAARKAQMIAARTYAVRYTDNGNPNYPICLTTYCQVSYFKNGDRNELDIVNATKDKVVTYNGSLIEALYSADNNQGVGPSDHDTRFQDFWGNATGSRPYLKAFNDNQYADSSRMSWEYYCPGSPCGLWAWRTNGYSYSDIDAMLKYVSKNSYYSSVAGNINQVRQSVGEVRAINLITDASSRVKKVKLTGTNGTATIGGWWFKSMWNAWVANKKPSGQFDYIYSQTYFLLTK